MWHVVGLFLRTGSVVRCPTFHPVFVGQGRDSEKQGGEEKDEVLADVIEQERKTPSEGNPGLAEENVSEKDGEQGAKRYEA